MSIRRQDSKSEFFKGSAHLLNNLRKTEGMSISTFVSVLFSRAWLPYINNATACCPLPNHIVTSGSVPSLGIKKVLEGMEAVQDTLVHGVEGVVNDRGLDLSFLSLCCTLSKTNPAHSLTSLQTYRTHEKVSVALKVKLQTPKDSQRHLLGVHLLQESLQLLGPRHHVPHATS